MFELEDYYFNKTTGRYNSQCKECTRETARASSEKNKYDKRAREQIKYARESGDMSSVECKRCKRYMPKSTFKSYDTRVFINDELILDGYTEICGYCYTVFKDKVFSKISGAIEYAKERRSKRSTKVNKAKIS